MSKRDLKKYLSELSKEQLEDQVMDLYDRFKEVKTFYNFVFKPKEEKLLEDAKIKISKEYYPTTTRRPKARRSVAQKIIKHWLQLGVDAVVISEIMLFNLEIAQQYAGEKERMPDTFFNSMLNSFREAVTYISDQGLQREYAVRLQGIATESSQQKWMNCAVFQDLLRTIEKR